jgi:hypothetical protein
MIPCKDCLIFAACRTQMKIATTDTVLRKLLPKCSLLQEYIDVEVSFVDVQNVIYSQPKLEAIRSYFHHYKG